MALSTYADLKTALKNWANRGSELDSYLDDIVTIAERRIYREVRHYTMETALSATIASGTIALPSSYVDLKYAYINTSPTLVLEMKSATWIYARYPLRSSDGKPKYIAREASTFIFGPYPDSNYAILGVYWKRLAALSSSSNTLWTDHPDLYLAASMCEVARFIDDPQLEQKYERMYGLVKAQVQNEQDNERIGGGGIAMAVA